MLLIDADVPVAQEIVLERTQFDAHLGGDVLDADRGEIGKSGPGADRRELVGLDVHRDVLAAVFVRECLQHGDIDGGDVLHIVAAVEWFDHVKRNPCLFL